TGVSFLTVGLMPKRLDLLHELVPEAGAAGLLVNPKNAGAGRATRSLQAAAQAKGIKLHVLEAGSENGIDAAFAALARLRIGGLVVSSDPYFFSRREQVVALAARAAVPAIFERREFAEAGGLISYGPSFPDSWRQVGVYAGKILKGAKPADLPVQQPTKFELVINLRAAKALGLTPPPTLLARADEVIE
ncbi:MAG TPA: ABC transporter substrate-binding protein, partial [Stellaceae bacterium]|nr:ABC transporter substrate-binding protein [Stellaceae bacterium]